MLPSDLIDAQLRHAAVHLAARRGLDLPVQERMPARVGVHAGACRGSLVGRPRCLRPPVGESAYYLGARWEPRGRRATGWPLLASPDRPGPGPRGSLAVPLRGLLTQSPAVLPARI